MNIQDIIARFRKRELVPWGNGYGAHKQKLIDETLKDPGIMGRFRDCSILPPAFGVRVDERVVEYPWVFSHLDKGADLILDAGSTFSKEFLLSGPVLKGRRVVIYTLSTDWITLNPNVSYIFGDFREMLLKDACVDCIACISTLEHVGLGQSYKEYSESRLAPDQDLFAYRKALGELDRVLKPGGQFLLTVPFGRRENHGWLQQFDSESLSDVVRHSPGNLVKKSFYRYYSEGWQTAVEEDCADARYFNIHAAEGFDPDYAAAARAVACLEFRKPLD